MVRQLDEMWRWTVWANRLGPRRICWRFAKKGKNKRHETNPWMTFHYTDCLLGILIMVYFNPHITGQYNPLYTLNNQSFSIAHIVSHNLLAGIFHGPSSLLWFSMVKDLIYHETSQPTMSNRCSNELKKIPLPTYPYGKSLYKPYISLLARGCLCVIIPKNPYIFAL